ncbi:MAG: AbrB/MazE/SpoVT family DNA-binding domain-containing protein [Nitrospirae bacterium]|nr:AbrB/MazE/SpoVT family DNA-binding domain-containing protein [Nitrospirota bacterium]
MSVARMTSKGQVTIPADVRKRLNIRSGDDLDFRVEPNGTVIILPITRRAQDVFGMLSKDRQPAVSIEDMHTGLQNAFRSGKI